MQNSLNFKRHKKTEIMKKLLLTLGCFICLLSQIIAQTDGITYQAVIISPNVLELPGIDSEDNYLPSTTIAIRFTIYDSGNQIEFQEVQITETDEFGRINLLIGDGDHDYFKEISWDGTPKDLKVEIDFDAGNNFETMSRERLTFLPFAYHRNITATGTLTVDDRTFLNGELQVEGPTNLNSTLNVNNGNATNLTGNLSVDGVTNLNEAFNVNNNSPTNLSGDVTVNGSSLLNGTLDVIGQTTLNDLRVNGEANFGDLSAANLTVTESTTISGQTFIDGQNSSIILTGQGATDTGLGKYRHPVIIQGSDYGLAIQVNGSRNNNTNFITFYDDTREIPWGRIEGETPAEFTNNADYNFDQSSLNYDIYDAGIDGLFAAADVYAALTGTAMALSSSTGCAGLGACVTAPIPSMIFKYTTESVVVTIQAVTAGAGIFIAIDNKNEYNSIKEANQGVTYASGAGDYAEYLMRQNNSEKMTYGDIVGVTGGKISKAVENAERFMVVSYKPIVLGNMPQENRIKDYEKVAFMGQVPVKVFGKVQIGDYIIPSGKNDGVGIAVSPNKIDLKDIKNIVGIAWSENNDMASLNYINVAIGINTNDNNHIVEALEHKINKQQEELNNLKTLVNEILETLTIKEKTSNTKATLPDDDTATTHQNHRKYEIIESDESDIIYFEITKEDIENAVVAAEEAMRESGMYEANIEVWNKLKTDQKFRNDFINELVTKLQKQIHYHKQIDKGRKN